MLAIVILLTTSISVYGFFYILRESTRYLCITSEYRFWILSSEEANFFNKFNASIAIITGLASAGRFLCNFPSFYNASISKRTNILNDFRVLHLLFIMWATKLGVTFGILFGTTNAYSEMDLYEDYKYLFYLFGIVLYMHLWTNARKLFKGLTKRLFIPVTLVFILSLSLLGSVNLLDSQRLDNKYLSKNPFNVLELKNPNSEYYIPGSKSELVVDLYFGYQKNNSTKPILFYKGATRGIDYVNEITREWKSMYGDHNHHRLTFYLNIDESIPMKYVKELEEKIEASKILKLSYVVNPENGKNLYSKPQLPFRIQPKLIDSLFPNRYDDLGKYSISIHDDSLMFNNKKISEKKLEEKIEKTIDDDPNYLFTLDYGADLSYRNYIKMYSKLYKVISNKRNEFSLLKYNTKFDWISRDKKKEILKKYPFFVRDSYK